MRPGIALKALCIALALGLILRAAPQVQAQDYEEDYYEDYYDYDSEDFGEDEGTYAPMATTSDEDWGDEWLDDEWYEDDDPGLAELMYDDADQPEPEYYGEEYAYDPEFEGEEYDWTDADAGPPLEVWEDPAEEWSTPGPYASEDGWIDDEEWFAPALEPYEPAPEVGYLPETEPPVTPEVGPEPTDEPSVSEVKPLDGRSARNALEEASSLKELTDPPRKDESAQLQAALAKAREDARREKEEGGVIQVADARPYVDSQAYGEPADKLQKAHDVHDGWKKFEQTLDNVKYVGYVKDGKLVDLYKETSSGLIPSVTGASIPYVGTPQSLVKGVLESQVEGIGNKVFVPPPRDPNLKYVSTTTAGTREQQVTGPQNWPRVIFDDSRQTWTETVPHYVKYGEEYIRMDNLPGAAPGAEIDVYTKAADDGKVYVIARDNKTGQEWVSGTKNFGLQRIWTGGARPKR